MRLVIGEGSGGGPPVPVIQDSSASLVVRTEHYSGRIDWEKGEADFSVQRGFETFGGANALRIVTTAMAYREGGFVLHAGAALRDGEAWLFCGPSGAGKSTTLRRLGRPVLHDDLVCISSCDLRPTTHGSRFHAWAPFALEAPRHPVRAVFALEQATRSRVERLSPARALGFLLMRPQVEGAAVSADELLERYGRFVQRVPAFRLMLNPTDPIGPLLEEAVE